MINFASPHTTYRDLFSRATLELTVKTLRKNYPALALQLQNAIVSTYPRGDYHSAVTATELPLKTEVAVKIVQALARLSENFVRARQTDSPDLVVIRSLLLDWLMFARACAYEEAAV